ncbi:hypothetical protein T10_1108 [Trichinella papuae]|uniref:Uncharacterized protein n=1 Tax=Trichinella papuae TaxID=268474 RepID=A0A0V1NAB4_9BILA|nr:hypothetical protein T10_1108 [Trichinella papuae]
MRIALKTSFWKRRNGRTCMQRVPPVAADLAKNGLLSNFCPTMEFDHNFCIAFFFEYEKFNNFFTFIFITSTTFYTTSRSTKSRVLAKETALFAFRSGESAADAFVRKANLRFSLKRG